MAFSWYLFSVPFCISIVFIAEMARLKEEFNSSKKHLALLTSQIAEGLFGSLLKFFHF